MHEGIRNTFRSLIIAAIALMYPVIAIAQLVDSAATSQAGNQFTSAQIEALKMPRLHSLLISRHSQLVFEEYYNGRTASNPANLKSASKSVISALVGIAIERGMIAGVNEQVADYFPEYVSQSRNADKQQITIENLLTMQSGLESTSNRNYGEWVLSENWVEFALDQPLIAKPGTDMLYSTGSTHLLSAILERASGMDTKQFAQQVLASELDFSIAYWSQDPQGIYFGGNDMEMTPRHMLRFGELYLNNGRYQDKQVIPAEWIEQSYLPHAVSPRGQGRFYGYGWWLRDLAGMQVPVAWGYGGQLIFVVKSLDLVIVATSASNPDPERRDHLSRLYDLVEDHILLPLVQQSSTEPSDFR